MVKRVSVSVASGRGVAERWRTQYQRDGKWTRTAKGDSEQIYNAICTKAEAVEWLQKQWNETCALRKRVAELEAMYINLDTN